MKRLKVSDHIVLVCWTEASSSIIEELLSEDQKTVRDIVIIDETLKECPFLHPRVHFVQGDPSDNRTLEKANMAKANTAILFADRKATDINAQDAKTILLTLAIESFNRDVYTCVEILNPENRKHLERANADEVICTTELSRNILVQSALNHGLSEFFKEILTFTEGSEIYRVRLGGAFVGMSYSGLAADLVRSHRVTLLAVEQDGRVAVNPASDVTIKEGSYIFVLAESFPEALEKD